MRNWKLAAILVLTLILGTAAFQNRASVQTRFLFFTVDMPLVVLLMLTAAGGFCLGLLVALLGKPKPKPAAPK
jgi:uncharacterized integral membrane protein